MKMLRLGRHCSTTHPSQSASCGSIHCHPFLALQTKDLSTKTKDRDGSVLMVASMGQQALAPAQGGRIRRRESGILISLQEQTCSGQEQVLWNSAAWTMNQTRHGGASIDSGARFQNFARSSKTSQWRAFSSVARYEKNGRLAARLPLSPSHASDTSWKTLVRLVEGSLIG